MRFFCFFIVILFANNLNAATYTYTGVGTWFDTANWSPSQPPDPGTDAGTTYIILGDCTHSGALPNILIDLSSNQFHISGRLVFEHFDQAFTPATISFIKELILDNGVLEIYSVNLNSESTFKIGDNTSINGSGLLGSGIIKCTFAPIDLDGVIAPGINSPAESGTIDVQGSFQFLGDYKLDMLSNIDYDSIITDNVNLFSNPIGTLSINGINNLSVVSSSLNITLITSTNGNFVSPSGFDANNTNAPNSFGFRANVDFVNGTPNGVLTFVDIEAPVISNCNNSDSNIVADCSIFYLIPDLTVGYTSTDNDNDTIISYTQNPPPGTPVLVGTTVVTITAVDSAGNESVGCVYNLIISEQTLTNDNPLDDIVSRQIIMYPNPSLGVFTIENTSGFPLDYGEVIDVKGGVVKTIDLTMNGFQKTIDLGTISKGFYLFRIQTVDGYVTKKIFIE